MFTVPTKNINLLDVIKDNISEWTIFKRYCPHLKEINEPFLSEFYDDTTPGCRVYQNSSNSLRYKDFGESDHHFNCYEYVMYKYSVTFLEALKIICNDFNINIDDNIPLTERKSIIGRESDIKETIINNKVKSFITIVERGWNLTDYNYWFKRFNISFEWLESYDVIPISHCYLHKGDRVVTFYSTKENPMYAYRFTYDGMYSYKIYFPLHSDKKRKWLFSGGCKDNIEGYDNLPLFDDLLIIQKSLKDVIASRLCGYSAISLQGEANRLEQELVNKIKKRFTNTIVFYDNDEQGLKSAASITLKYGFKSIVIPEKYKCKDLSEMINLIGLNESKTVLKRMLNEHNS